MCTPECDEFLRRLEEDLNVLRRHAIQSLAAMSESVTSVQRRVDKLYDDKATAEFARSRGVR